jgi:single-strand DNA-binding protein
MLGINKIILMGTVGRNPDTRYIGKGVSYSRFSLCTNDMTTLSDGREVEVGEWHEVVAGRQLSDYASRYVKKGDTVYVIGKLLSRYVSRGEGGYRVYEVIANELKIISRSKANAETPVPEMEPINEDIVGSALPDFDIENIPASNIAADELPF